MAGLTVGGEQVSDEDARLVVVGYAFGREPFVWEPRSRHVVGERPAAETVGAWGYWTYDCVRPGGELGLSDIDLFIASGLNGNLGVGSLRSLLAVEPEVSAALVEAAPVSTTPFWDLTPDEVARPPDDVSSSAWLLWRAWWLMIYASDVEVAIAHKTLHHKRPDLFPLLDNKTLAALTVGQAWQQVHAELNATPDGWQRLEEDFAAKASDVPGAVRLTRLRLHDILLWTRATGRWEFARDAGTKLR